MLALPDLLKSIRKPNSVGSGENQQGIFISDKEINWLKNLHDKVRNEFVHFSISGWSLEISGISDFANVVACIIGNILDAGWAFRDTEDCWRNELRSNLAELSSFGTRGE